MNRTRIIEAPNTERLNPILMPLTWMVVGALAAAACSSDGDGSAEGGSGYDPGGAANASGRGGVNSVEAGRQHSGGAREGGSGGAVALGGNAGDMSGGSAGDSDVAGQGGGAGACAPGYSDRGDGCIAACAPHDLDGASIALSIGHVDLIAAEHEAGASELSLFVSDDSFPIRQARTVRRTPEGVLVHGKPSAVVSVPDIPALSGLFVPGTDIWLLPEGQPEAEASGLIWPGLQSYGFAAGSFSGDVATLRLVSRVGPGRFVGFSTVQDEQTPPALLFDPTNGLDEFPLPVATHLHLNWAFTEGGLHRLSFELEAVTPGGMILNSAAHTYRFFFGDLSDLPASEPTIVTAGGLEASYLDGGELSLTAERHGATNSLPAAWSRQCYDSLTFDPLPWEPVGIGDTLATKAINGCQYVVCLMDGNEPVAISQAVLPTVE